MAVDIDQDRCIAAFLEFSDELARTGPTSASDGSPGDLIRFARETSSRMAHRLRASLADLHPEIGWTREDARPDGRDYWLYDPIDGAYHFLQGLPLWSSSLTLVRRDRPVWSLVYDPKGAELFAAIDHGGAICNGAPIAISPKTNLTAAVVGTAIPPLAQVGDAEHAEALSLLDAVSHAVFVVRPMAAVSLQLAYVRVRTTRWVLGERARRWRLAGRLPSGPRGRRHGHSPRWHDIRLGWRRHHRRQRTDACRSPESSNKRRETPWGPSVTTNLATSSAGDVTRRVFLGTGLAAVTATSAALSTNARESTMTSQDSIWPGNARLAVSFSLMFEGRRPTDFGRRRCHPRAD